MAHAREFLRVWLVPRSGMYVLGGALPVIWLPAILLVGAGPARAAGRGDAKGITDGTAKCGMTYHLAVPPSYDARKGLPAIVILHGAGANSSRDLYS